MWRSFFLAVGIFLCVLGAECLAVDQVVLKLREPPPQGTGLFTGGNPSAGPQRVVRPPEWAPWSLLGAGAITMIYSFTLPRWVKGDG